jgi:(p)ppGpp synthase/HD superfamily hydrolase
MILRDAIQFMEQAHAGQIRKLSGKPYSVHPRAVVHTLATMVRGVDLTTLVAGALHDVVEDTPYDIFDIQRRFGPQVSTLVLQVTNAKQPALNRTQRAKYQRDKLAIITPQAQNIKYADILDNITNLATDDPKFAAVYLPEKRLQLAVMGDGYAPLRGHVWNQLLTEERILRERR